ncbi:MAG: hypothetical protein ACFFFT_00045 [Candidatus Thorarchaeota archaeon]
MIDIVYNVSGVEPQCSICGDTGKIYIYRSDWEEFDEIECQCCKFKWKQTTLEDFNDISRYNSLKKFRETLKKKVNNPL